MLALQYLTFSFTLWLGLYLAARNPRNTQLLFAGLGALAYSTALAVEALAALTDTETLTVWRWPVLILPMLCWAVALAFVWRNRSDAQPKSPRALILVATLFFGLGLGLIVFPLNLIPRAWALWAISFDFVALGLAIARLDAFEEGETLWRDMVRSFAASAVAVLVFGGLVTMGMWLGTGVSPAMFALLLAVTVAAVGTQVFADPLQTLLDRLAISPPTSEARAQLRAVAAALPRADEGVDPLTLDEAEFARHTRRALSHLGDLSRLAASPLTRLPAVTARCAARGVRADSLERAVELKALLTDSIHRLKPRDQGDFGTTDEWRHFNALFFPYVAGLKPYAVRGAFMRAEPNGFGASERAALDWFRAQVPERTLHNWQNAAARLVAKDIRERL
ncbi:MAG: hypothetical protein ACT4QE_19000 [Anaerolineales bacterium]